jgi:hypothetical protein
MLRTTNSTWFNRAATVRLTASGPHSFSHRQGWGAVNYLLRGTWLANHLPDHLPHCSRHGKNVLLLRRRRARMSAGSLGRRPVVFAKRLRISVSETTPIRRPDKCAPGRADAGTEVNPGTFPPLPPGTGMGECGPTAVDVAEGMRTVDSRRACPSPVPFVAMAGLPRMPVTLGDLEWPGPDAVAMLALDTEEDIVCTGERSGV